MFVGIETDRGPWVVALRAASYHVYAINPMSSARYRDRYSTSGAKSDAGDAHVLAEIAGDTDLADAVKLLGRAHQNLIWERVRHVLRLRSALLEFFPVAVQTFPDLPATDALILLGRAPDPARAAKLTRSQVVSALTAARRYHIADKAEPLQALLRQPGLRQPAAVEAAHAAIVAGQNQLAWQPTPDVHTLAAASAGPALGWKPRGPLPVRGMRGFPRNFGLEALPRGVPSS